MQRQAFDSVWDALEPDPVMRANLKLLSASMRAITQWFEAIGYTQKEAAAVLGTTQPHLNDVLKGKISRCTTDRLVKMLEASGWFAERQGKSDFVQFRSILLRKGGLPPCEGDTL